MEVLEEDNPLNTYTTNKFNSNHNNSMINCAGRPPNSKSIKFSEQPKSIISQMFLVEQRVIDKNTFEPGDHIVPEIFENSSEQRTIKEVCKKDTTTDIKIYSCTYNSCSYSTKISSNLTKHKRTHSQDKLYLCDECTFSTKFSNSLNVHKRLHSNIKPFYCQYCEYRCNSSSNLKKHRSHRHSNKLNVIAKKI